eukprot:GHRQ01018347.1.p2 GENE.GHRQ01018347.1~~GHRQ01018347.1.p2  ORF type:complete len:111 (+),score=8.73 GHRQ01018347.1:373-705(+)
MYFQHTYQLNAAKATAIWLPTAALFFTSWMFAAREAPSVLLRMASSRNGVTCGSGGRTAAAVTPTAVRHDCLNMHQNDVLKIEHQTCDGSHPKSHAPTYTSRHNSGAHDW